MFDDKQMPEQIYACTDGKGNDEWDTNYKLFGGTEYIRHDIHAALVERVARLEKSLSDITDLYDADEGCRSLPQYINARAALDNTDGGRDAG